jgi:acyl carrier protein
MGSIEEEVTQIISRVTKIPAAEILPDTDLRLDLNIDSLQGLQIMAALEQHFDVTVPDDELGDHSNVREIVAAVQALRAS